MRSSYLIPVSLIILLTIISTGQAVVPSDKRFRYFNAGELGEYSVEYGDYRPLDISTFPFMLCFQNSTPYAFTLSLRMGSRRSESIMRWVWDANRGKPVRENASLAFGADGNLVLADVDGSVAWQTGTANKGVVGLELLQTGNLVLYNAKGAYIWQSFDHPTDTLVLGQGLHLNGPTKLVSRLSYMDAADGPYTLVMEKRHLAMYYKSDNAVNSLLYYKYDDFGDGKGVLADILFGIDSDEPYYTYDLFLAFKMKNSLTSGTSFLARPKYNATYSMLRLDIDGNLRIHTYYPNVDWGAWDVTYEVLNRVDGVDRTSECRLPSKCGSLGVCEENQCVACPTAAGLLGWSKSCAPPILPACKGRANVDYYKVAGVEHFMNGYTEGGGIKFVDCREKCNKDCKCAGFFYREESSKCLLVPELGTLIKVSRTSHVGYIKMSK
ncbi:epidermis-specific secreted glycoprotein EP1-like [Apium graveolens]|uniref:epidermis-specific secreted glycoprotein EP1-like n=1 Tax=Apium graveolens TaxID=4045 RepID=UPI003D7B3784